MNKTTTILETLLWPALLLVVGLVIVQAHAIPYWQERAGAALGVLWSLGLEAAALWLLYRPGRWSRAGGLAVALALVAVPLWQVTRPALAEWQALQAARAERAGIERRIASLEASLRTYEQNSTARLGWYPLIEQTRAEIAAARAREAELLPPLAGGGWEGGWRWAIELGPVALSLILFQAMNIVAIRQLARFRATAPVNAVSQPVSAGLQDPGNSSERRVPAAPSAPGISARPAAEISDRPAPKPVPVSPEGRYDLFTLKALRDRIGGHLEATGQPRNAFCARIGISEPDLSSFMGLFDRERRSARKPSRRAVETLLAAFPAEGEAARS
jgi:hypothetical protein